MVNYQNLELSEQEIVRRNCLEELKQIGIEPYPHEEFKVSHHSTEILEKFKDGEDFGEVTLAGRLMGRRVMGKASFAELQDADGRIQLYVSREHIAPD